MSPILILIIILPFLALTFLHLSKPKPKKGPDPSSISELIKNGHRIVEWTSDLTNSSHTATVTTAMGVITANPTVVEHITKTKFEAYVKGDNLTSILHDFMGDGIFNSEGEHWKLQRRTASLEFTTKIIRTFVISNIRTEVINRLFPSLQNLAASQEPFDIQELLERFAFDNVCKVVFNEDLDRLGADSPEAREFNEAFERASNLCVGRFASPVPGLWKLKRWLNVGSEKEAKKNIDIVHRFATKVIKSRRLSTLGEDLLSRFMAENEGCSDEFLRDVIVSFVIAGRDTTSAALTWFVWEVGRKPEVRRRILEEIERVRIDGLHANGVLGLEQVREMEYMHAVLSETLRLHPPAPLLMRSCREEDVLPDGTKVKKGRSVLYNSYAMGRSRRIWGDDCGEFRPERWLDGEGVFQPRSPYVYPVFHAGPRMCLGKDMAYVQMKVVAAAIVERFDLEVVEKEAEREHELIFIMKMKGGLRVTVRERK